MATRTILKSHPRPHQSPAWFANHQVMFFRGITALSLCAICLFGGWGFRQWYLQTDKEAVNRYLLPAKDRFSSQFSARWFSALPVPAFKDGKEDSVRAYLAMEPCLELLVDQRSGSLWMRQGDVLVPSAHPPLEAFYRALAAKLAELGTDSLSPGQGRDPDFGWFLRVAVAAGDWTVIKCVAPGGAALEAELGQILGHDPDISICLHHQQPDPRRPGARIVPERFTAFQIPKAHVKGRTWVISYWSRNHPEGWVWSVLPSASLRTRMQLFLLRRMALLLVPLLVLVGLLIVIFRMRQMATRQAELAKDRLASLTHGLKTPLAVIKAWCDATRHGRMERDKVDLTFIRIGEQVDQLTGLIDNGLRALHPKAAAGRRAPVTREWLWDLASEFQLLCSEAGRDLDDRHLEAAGGEASLDSLHQVLQTLMENALIHGREGTITFSSERKGSRLFLRVQDEGPGLETDQLDQLGQPFQRFHRGNTEGFEARGMGLGLSLAIQIAEKEGWGVKVQSEPDRGLWVTLEIRD